MVNIYSSPLPPYEGGNDWASIKSSQKLKFVSGFKTSPFGGGLRGRIILYQFIFFTTKKPLNTEWL
jgi:hypothetical protein